MISCLIVDDEISAIKVLTSYVEKTPFLSLTATASDPLEALKIVQEHPVDLIFLDIQMPQFSGIEFAKMMKDKTQVVLTTAYSEFALEGYEQEVLDYLLKPVSFERFLKAAQRALTLSAFSAPEWQPTASEDDYMFVKTETKGKMLKISFKDIYYIEGLGNYVTIHTATDGIITYASFKELEQRLPPEFVRVQKSYIVSMNYVRAIDGNQIFLEGMKAHVPLGESYRTKFFKFLQEKTMGGRK